MLILSLLFLSLQTQASVEAKTCTHPFDVEVVDFAEGSHGNKIQLVTERGVAIKARKQYANPDLLNNDIFGFVLLHNAIQGSISSLTNVRAVKILDYQKPNTIDIELATGAVVENVADRQNLSEITPYQRNARLRMRDVTDQVDLRKPPTELEQWFLDRPHLIDRMQEAYNTMVEKLKIAIEKQAFSQNIEILILEMTKYDGKYLSLYIAYKLPNSETTRYIYIKPDNLVITKDFNFIIFDPY